MRSEREWVCGVRVRVFWVYGRISFAKFPSRAPVPSTGSDRKEAMCFRARGPSVTVVQGGQVSWSWRCKGLGILVWWLWSFSSFLGTDRPEAAFRVLTYVSGEIPLASPAFFSSSVRKE